MPGGKTAQITPAGELRQTDSPAFFFRGIMKQQAEKQRKTNTNY